MDQLLFCIRVRGSTCHLESVSNVYTSTYQKLNLNPNSYSSHFFRRGAATFAFQYRVPAKLIQAQGDWTIQIYKILFF